MVRAMALYRIDRNAWAQREWDDALSRFDDTQRRLAVEVAQDNGWFDRAVFALGRKPEELRLYTLRFPLHHDAGDPSRSDKEQPRSGMDGGRDPRRKRVQSERALRRPMRWA